MKNLIRETPPLILTIALEEATHKYFTELRNQYFPKHFNYLEAHLTLFHHLPSDEPMISEVLSALSQQQVMDLEVAGVKNIGNGVAFAVVSEELSALHKSLQQAFKKYTISQDRQKLWPHITVQNKVTAFKAAQTFEILSKPFEPFKIKGTGIDSWLYMKGPWQHHNSYPFIDKG